MRHIILIYLKNHNKPFEVEFETETMLKKFYDELKKDIVTVGQLTFLKENFDYCIKK